MMSKIKTDGFVVAALQNSHYEELAFYALEIIGNLRRIHSDSKYYMLLPFFSRRSGIGMATVDVKKLLEKYCGNNLGKVSLTEESRMEFVSLLNIRVRPLLMFHATIIFIKCCSTPKTTTSESLSTKQAKPSKNIFNFCDFKINQFKSTSIHLLFSLPCFLVHPCCCINLIHYPKIEILHFFNSLVLALIFTTLFENRDSSHCNIFRNSFVLKNS